MAQLYLLISVFIYLVVYLLFLSHFIYLVTAFHNHQKQSIFETFMCNTLNRLFQDILLEVLLLVCIFPVLCHCSGLRC